MHVADIEKELKRVIEEFDQSEALRTCRTCGYVQPAQVTPMAPPRPRSGARAG
jgi:hypothetical protein